MILVEVKTDLARYDPIIVYDYDGDDDDDDDDGDDI